MNLLIHLIQIAIGVVIMVDWNLEVNELMETELMAGVVITVGSDFSRVSREIQSNGGGFIKETLRVKVMCRMRWI